MQLFWRRAGLARLIAVVATVAAIALTHRSVSADLLWIHEVLKRLYYLPIVVAALHFGFWGGTATSIVVSVLFLWHALTRWHGWGPFAIDSYGELVLFNIIGPLTGVLADRLRREENRLRDSYAALDDAYRRLEGATAARVAATRLATIGTVAADVAHAVRTPFSAIHGCFEILAADYPRGHPKREFVEILRTEIRRADAVIQDLVDVADQAPPRAQWREAVDGVSPLR